MLANQKILVTGALGKSGRAAVELFLELGASVIVSDKKEGPLPETWDVKSVIDVRPEDGENLIDEYRPDAVVTAPGVPLSNPIFHKARSANIPVYGESDFAYDIMQKRYGKKPFLAGVTGTDGKSTTTALISHLLNVCGLKSVPCGNFGLPLSELAKSGAEKYDIYVAELSSYQLEPLQFMKPEVSMILNLAEDHLDRYSGMDDYLRAKLHILDLQDEGDLFLGPDSILKAAEAYAGNNPAKPRMMVPPVIDDEIVFMNFKKIPASEFALTGTHNFINLSFALLTLEDILKRKDIVISREKLIEGLGSFRGLHYRFENLGTKKGIRFINDSKSTTCQSLLTAVNSLKNEPVFLLCGGRNKGIDFSDLKNCGSNVRFFPYGEAGPEMASIVGEKSHRDMNGAFEAAVQSALSVNGAVVLLSPGCSSFDLYGSYLERGEHFQKLVENL